MEVLVWNRIVSADVVQVWHVSFALELVNEFGLPEQHGVSLVFVCFFNFSCIDLFRLLFFNLIDFSKGSASEFLLYHEASF